MVLGCSIAAVFFASFLATYYWWKGRYPSRPGTAIALRHPAFCASPCTFWGVLSIDYVDSGWYVVNDIRSGEIVESGDYTCRLVGYIVVEDCLAGSVEDIKGNPAYWFIIHKDTPTRSTQYRSYGAWLAALPKPQ